MKKIDLSTFVYQIFDELKDFEERQNTINCEQTKSMEDWINYFLIYSGYKEEDDDSYENSEYLDNFDYDDEFGYEDLVNRRKYRSFREDDRY